MLQPKASADPTPIKQPPTSPLKSSHGGAIRSLNCRASRAAANAPPMMPKFSTEVEYKCGVMISRSANPIELKNQSPQFRTPSAALQGFSKANRNTLMAPKSTPPNPHRPLLTKQLRVAASKGGAQGIRRLLRCYLRLHKTSRSPGNGWPLKGGLNPFPSRAELRLETDMEPKRRIAPPVRSFWSWRIALSGHVLVEE